MPNEITTKQIWVGIFLVVLLIGGYIGADQLLIALNKKKAGEEIEKKIDRIEKSISPYEKKNSLNRTEIIKDFTNSSVDNKPTDSIGKNIFTNGLFEEGYLYVRASVDGNSLGKSDGVYVKITGKIDGKYQELGGHLIGRGSLEVPKSDSFTEFLFNLSDVKYKDRYFDSDVEVKSGNWLSALNQGDNKILIAFSSTTRSGKIEELSFYYSCIEGFECLIEAKQ